MDSSKINDNIIINNELIRDLLLEFYQHLIDNDPLPINTFSKHREVDRFIQHYMKLI